MAVHLKAKRIYSKFKTIWNLIDQIEPRRKRKRVQKLTVCLSVCLSASLSVCLPVCLWFFLKTRLNTLNTCAASRVIVGIISTCSANFLFKQAKIPECATIRSADLFFVWWTTVFTNTSKLVWRRSYAVTVVLANCICTRIKVWKVNVITFVCKLTVVKRVTKICNIDWMLRTARLCG